MKKPSIYIIDDNDDFRQSVAFMLSSSMYQVEKFSSAEAVLASLERLEHDELVCLLLDVRMPGLSGLDLHDRVNAFNPDLPIIYMTGHADVSLAIEVMKKGAITLLEKPLDPDLLESSVEAAMDAARKRTKRQVFSGVAEQSSPPEKGRSADEVIESEAFEQRLKRLTPREKEVLEHLIQGMANKQCAFELNISVRTVELHRARLLRKLEVRSAAELIRAVLLNRSHE